MHHPHSIWRCLFPAMMTGVALLSSGAGAYTLDLTTPGASGTINGALFTQTDLTAADVGGATEFLRIQGHTGVSVGYNTDGVIQFDTKTNFTRSILLSSVPVVLKDGIYYREFLLSNQEPAAASKRLISLDGLSIFLSPTGNSTGVDLLNPAAALGVPVYSLNAGGDNAVIMDASLSKGPNRYDVAIDIPVSAFPASPNLYVTFLATFGITNASEGAFEQFAIGTRTIPLPPCAIPLPSAAWTGLSTLALLAAVPAGKRLRRRLGVQSAPL
jgi:hypothetical protein